MFSWDVYTTSSFSCIRVTIRVFPSIPDISSYPFIENTVQTRLTLSQTIASCLVLRTSSSITYCVYLLPQTEALIGVGQIRSDDCDMYDLIAHELDL